MDYEMISADDHIDLGYLPQDLWEKRLPKSLSDRGPKVVHRDQGDFWVCDGETWGDWRGGPWWSKQKPRNAVYAQDRGGVAEDYVLRPTIPELRIADMARDNVEASVMFGPILPMNVSDVPLRHACISAYNDWLVEFCSAAPHQFIGVGMLPTDDGAAAAHEVERARKIGIRQVNFLVGMVTPGIYNDKAWEVFWDAAEDSEMVVSYHIGGGSPLPPAWPQKMPAFRFGLGSGFQSFLEPFAGLFAFGVLERHPRLRFVMAESGTGWIPYVVQEMDYRYHRTLERKAAGDPEPLKYLPSETFRRQVWATYQEDRVGLDLVKFFGEGHMMWASDYPHPDSTWPNSVPIVESETEELPPNIRRQILRENAKAFYGL